MEISSISSMMDNQALQAQLDMLDQELQQTIVVQQDTQMVNNSVQATQLDAFATSTIQPSNS